MKISKNWLKKYVHLAECTDAELENALTMIGFEVEGIENTGVSHSEGIVVGEVETRRQHPNADRLSISLVNVGDSTSRHIVCGASNYKVGDRVLVALPGARVLGPEGEPFKIKKSKLRGEVSEGMMCSARELGIGEDQSGLLILEDRPEIGTPLESVLPEPDTIFDIEITPNRPDCLSHVGMARELAAFFDLRLCYPEAKASRDGSRRSEPVVRSIRVEAEEECPLYYGYSIRGVKIEPSPAWLQRAIESVGLRPVNNVVDVTNYVLMELGQPLHAFDPAKIRGGELIIRQAHAGEVIATLDERRRELSPSMTVIADGERPLVVAGIMGSLDAEVDNSTTDILLEAAYFRPRFIRRTSRKLGLSTDSSYRFERGVDPQNVEFAALRAIDLILEVAGGAVSGPAFQVGNPPMDSREITLEPSFVRKSLGFGPDNRSIRQVLESLELDVRVEEDLRDEETWQVSIPSFRRDLERPVDLVEEFLRIYGTDKIPDSPVEARVAAYRTDPVAEFNRRTAELLVGRQFNECMMYSLRSEEETRSWRGHAEAELLALSNPMTSDQTHLRPSLIPGLLDSLRLNASRNTGMERVFERGRVFRDLNGSVLELLSVAFLVFQRRQGLSWKEREPVDFFHCKAIMQSLLELVGREAALTPCRSMEGDASWMEGRSGIIGDLEGMGFEARLGLISPERSRAWDLDGLVFGGSLLVEPGSLHADGEIPRYQALSHFPPVTKDLALVVGKSVPADEVRRDLEKVAVAASEGFSVESVKVFDVYEGQGLPAGRKSLAFSIVFRSTERTLSDKEVNVAFERLQKAITEEKGGAYAIR